MKKNNHNKKYISNAGANLARILSRRKLSPLPIPSSGQKSLSQTSTSRPKSLPSFSKSLPSLSKSLPYLSKSSLSPSSSSVQSSLTPTTTPRPQSSPASIPTKAQLGTLLKPSSPQLASSLNTSESSKNNIDLFLEAIEELISVYKIIFNNPNSVKNEELKKDINIVIKLIGKEKVLSELKKANQIIIKKDTKLLINMLMESFKDTCTGLFGAKELACTTVVNSKKINGLSEIWDKIKTELKKSSPEQIDVNILFKNIKLYLIEILKRYVEGDNNLLYSVIKKLTEIKFGGKKRKYKTKLKNKKVKKNKRKKEIKKKKK